VCFFDSVSGVPCSALRVRSSARPLTFDCLFGDFRVGTLDVLYSFRPVRFYLGRPKWKPTRAHGRVRKQPIVELVRSAQRGGGSVVVGGFMHGEGRRTAGV